MPYIVRIQAVYRLGCSGVCAVCWLSAAGRPSRPLQCREGWEGWLGDLVGLAGILLDPTGSCRILLGTTGDYAAIGQLYRAGLSRARVLGSLLESSTRELYWRALLENSTGELYWRALLES